MVARDIEDTASYIPLSILEGLKNGSVHEVIDKDDSCITWQDATSEDQWQMHKRLTSTETIKDWDQESRGGSQTARIARNLRKMPIRVEVTLNGYKIWALIDSGASADFIDHRIARANGLYISVKATSYQLRTVDGTPVDYRRGAVDIETFPLEMVMPGGHTELITLDVTSLGDDHILLGMPWLMRHNPSIDWTSKTVELNRCRCGTKHQTARKAE